jgi:hypothetical protein
VILDVMNERILSEGRPVEPAAAMIESLAIVVRTPEGVVTFAQERDLVGDDDAVALVRHNETIAAEHNTMATSD